MTSRTVHCCCRGCARFCVGKYRSPFVHLEGSSFDHTYVRRISLAYVQTIHVLPCLRKLCYRGLNTTHRCTRCYHLMEMVLPRAHRVPLQLTQSGAQAVVKLPITCIYVTAPVFVEEYVLLASAKGLRRVMLPHNQRIVMLTSTNPCQTWQEDGSVLMTCPVQR